jgi:hypothetical protein
MNQSPRRWLFTLIALGGLTVASTAAAGAKPGQAPKKPASPPASSFNPAQFNPPLPSSITSALAQMPVDSTGLLQTEMDHFSWLSFIALNWPSNTATCEPDTSQSILTGKGPTVWETFLLDNQVFVAPGSKPVAWCAQSSLEDQLAALPEHARAAARKSGVTRSLVQLGKAHHPEVPRIAAGTGNDERGIQQVVGGVLVDQNGRFARYEVRMNQDEYNYLTTNNLWNKAGQKGATFNFPLGPDTANLCAGKSCGPTGAVEIKAAWKVLGKGDDPSRFYTIQAIVFNDDSSPTPQPSPGKNPVTLGLVGMHIVHKTVSQQKNWIWSTFEQVDNVTTSFNNKNCPQTPVYSAKAPKVPCTTACCVPNVPTAAKRNGTYVELDASGNPLNKPAQVVRVASIEPVAQYLNGYFQNLLKGSVWANYQLVSTQWVDAEIGNQTHQPSPAYLANTTIETYNQGPVKPTAGPNPYPSPKYNPFTRTVSSSCIMCHSKGNNFSFLPSEAQ